METNERDYFESISLIIIITMNPTGAAGRPELKRSASAMYDEQDTGMTPGLNQGGPWKREEHIPVNASQPWLSWVNDEDHTHNFLFNTIIQRLREVRQHERPETVTIYRRLTVEKLRAIDAILALPIWAAVEEKVRANTMADSAASIAESAQKAFPLRELYEDEYLQMRKDLCKAVAAYNEVVVKIENHQAEHGAVIGPFLFPFLQVYGQ